MLNEVETVYEVVQRCLSRGGELSVQALELAHGEVLDYDAIYAGTSGPFHLLAPIDVPGVPSKLTISGTGLTHLGSAKERQAMHIATAAKTAEDVTDSMRMFQWGVEEGVQQRVRLELRRVVLQRQWLHVAGAAQASDDSRIRGRRR